MSIIEVKNLSYKYANKLIIDKVNFSAKSSEITAILGPSGSGKSTFIKLLAGFISSQKGKILLDNKLINNLEPQYREISYVSQTPSLFPFLNIYENINLAIKGKNNNEKKLLVKKLLAKFNMADKISLYPHNLSVGEQQRVSIIRAMASEAKVMLFDEPYANIDSINKDNLISESLNLLKNSNLIKIMITHNIEEALLFADKIYVLYEGKILQAGTASDLYHQPKNQFVARSFGLINKLHENNKKYFIRATDFKISKKEIKGSFKVNIIDKKFYFGRFLYHVQRVDLQTLRIISDMDLKTSDIIYVTILNKLKI
ncbi:MAG: ABC transporter ATP-binding protein [Rickettsiales bacterium]|nr:ABC transporter ATP-binding protein [Rickettsiales bacterium]